ncbi:hypothetical protein Kpho01_32630 [Kitasatospora phosalacinea]|uniref:Uncharacterized protein n=1 Tax=Kitasatospora phosalacinea TaxID=2065 RepID=A0A9W6PI37_9ACTN|nr:hypothetical protein Kpho01_32630 [Kitasatospora phosalacinea]
MRARREDSRTPDARTAAPRAARGGRAEVVVTASVLSGADEARSHGWTQPPPVAPQSNRRPRGGSGVPAKRKPGRRTSDPRRARSLGRA